MSQKLLGKELLYESARYSKSRSSMAWSRVFDAVGVVTLGPEARQDCPPTGSLILRLIRALFFIPTTRRSILIALAVLPARPITLLISSGWTSRVMSTPISSTVLFILISSGCPTKAFTTYSRNCTSSIMEFSVILRQAQDNPECNRRVKE